MIAPRALLSLLALTAVFASSSSSEVEHMNEVKIMEGHTLLSSHHSPLPHTYIEYSALPDSFDWGNKDGVSYLTKSLNQHIPQYCGSCWAHGALSSLADRIKIARKAEGVEINLSIQFILNCGAGVAGSCHGGYHTGVYQLIKEKGFVPFDTCQPYLACSAESDEGFCKHVDTTCTAQNTCRTCSTFTKMGGSCREITPFPNATVAEYGGISLDAEKTMAEIFARGPVAATVNAGPMHSYDGNIISDVHASKQVNHIVSITGWGKDPATGKQYWHVRNSWGEYWGNLGYAKIELGKNILGIESSIAWATPGTYTVLNTPCNENGKNCAGTDKKHYETYVDPSTDVEAVQRSLGML